MATMLHHHCLVTAVLLALLLVNTQAKSDNSPPVIMKQPKKETPYNSGEEIRLPCVATGVPAPTYKWSKDDKLIEDLSSIDAHMMPQGGTLIIKVPKENENDMHEGYYQCAAENQFGKALSVRTLLKRARLSQFKVSDVSINKPFIGQSLTLPCNPPNSYPKPSIHWAIADSVEGDMPTPIFNTRRQAVDYEGNLLFANVIPSDWKDGNNYLCVLWNWAWRGSSQGNDQKVIPVAIHGKPRYRAPLLIYPRELLPIVALEGATHKMMCFFTGFPTPNVTWEKVGSTGLPAGANQDPNTGLELIFKKLKREHAGMYKCCGNNQQSGPAVCKERQLIVESRPVWEQPPKDTEAADEEDATITCKAKGTPPPSIVWSVNGEVLDPSNLGERRKIGENSITFLNLNRSDNVVVQCNASNTHGYIFKNAFLSVKSEPPVFQRPLLAANTKAAINSKAPLNCRAYGVPKPKIVWQKNGKVVDDPRFQVQQNGDLHISPVKRGDEGSYECIAENKLDRVTRKGNLIVRNATKITLHPKDQVVNAPQQVVFHCGAETDRNEQEHLNINWKRDGSLIKLEREQHISKNTIDNSLIIEKTSVSDTNTYTCIASSLLDSVEFSVNLTVRDKPDPPRDVVFRDCSGRNTVIEWQKGKNNNAPIDYFIVYSNTSFDSPGVYKKEVETIKQESLIPLSNWANYTFHVIAHNEVGFSEKSKFTATCETPASKPYVNPTGVCTENRESNLLVIRWHDMPKIEHNGPDFMYQVSYKLKNSKTGFITKNVTKYDTNELVVPDQEPYHLYDIKVSSHNRRGYAYDKVKLFSGYSGEAPPKEAPSKLRLLNDTLNATSAMFEWHPVDTRPSKIRGHFIGYQIQYWKSDDTYEKKRVTNIIRGSLPEKCPMDIPAPKNRGKREVNAPPQPTQPTVETGHVLDLWPASKITAVVVVLTSKLGPQSKSVEFTTPEGVPGKVASFGVTQIGSDHFVLEWTPPTVTNGKIVGYTLTYNIVGDDKKETVDIDNPLKFQMKLIGLKADTSYMLELAARTSAGMGIQTPEDARTRVASSPDVPGFANIQHGKSSLNVSWVHSEGKQENPGSEFYVEYRKQGTQYWNSTTPEAEQTWANITGLEHGANYEIRIVAKNSHNDVTRSKPKVIKVGGVEVLEVQENIATAGWFIVIMVVLILLLLVLIIVCLIKRNRGGKYPVHEKEKLRGHHPEKEDEENQFGEYTKTPYMELKQSDEPDYKKSAGSLDSEEKPIESDTDSMAEYDQMDPSKFNEDGSFIGQYGGKAKHDQDTTSPSALSTFV